MSLINEIKLTSVSPVGTRTELARKTGGSWSLEISDLAISFDIKKTIGKEKNTAKIKIYNLSETNRSEFLNRGSNVTLGFGKKIDDTILGPPSPNDQPIFFTIFKGDVFNSSSFAGSEADKETLIECSTGGKAYNQVVNWSLGPASRIDEILGLVTKSLKDAGVTMGTDFVREYKEKSKKQGTFFPTGWAVSAKLEKALSMVFSRIKQNYSIQDDVFYYHSVFDPSQVNKVLLTPQTGLISSVSKIQKRLSDPTEERSQKKEVNGIKFKCQIIPGIQPGNLVEIDSRYAKGDYVLHNCRYVGGTRVVDCYILCEAIEFGTH